MPRQARWETHLVQSGETLSNIAARYGMSVDEIARANGIGNPNLVFAGMELKVRRYYEVQSGDTLTWIAQDFGLSLQDILSFHRKIGKPITNPDLIFPGQRIYLPGIGDELPKAAADPAKPDPLPSAPKTSSETGIPGINTGAPPTYDDDIVPAHRRVPNPSFLQIGDVQFVVPPTFIEVRSVNDIGIKGGLRRKNQLKVRSGYAQTEIRVDLWFVDLEQINGTPMPNPEGGFYYMDGLRALIAQFKKTPILPICNEYLNDVHEIYNVALSNLIVTTVPGFPNTLKATLVMQKTTVEPYIMRPDEDYADMICWPVFRWFYQQMVTDGPRAGTTYLEPIRTPYMTGDFKFWLLDERVMDEAKRMQDVGYDWTKYMKEIPLSADPSHPNAQITSMIISMRNMLAPLHTQLQTSPTFQYMSGMDTEFIVEMRMDREALQNLIQLKNMSDEYSVKYRDRFVSGFVRFENELCQLFGVQHVLIQSINAKTIEGFPGWFDVSIVMISHDRNQRRTEQPMQLTYAAGTYDDLETVFEGDFNHIEHPIVVERLMNALELYPDLELPTYEEVERAVQKINAQRKQHGLKPLEFNLKRPDPERFQQTQGATFVDPDFYVCYTGLAPGGILHDAALSEALNQIVSKVDVVSGAAGSENTPTTDTLTREQVMSGVWRFPYRPLTMIDSGHPLYKYVDKWARHVDIDPNLVATFIWWENRGLDLSVSQMNKGPNSRGATGIMQITEAVAKAYGYTLADMLDPDKNIEVGTKTLAERAKRQGYKLHLIAADYNAGPGAVEKFKQWAGGRDDWPSIKAAIERNTTPEGRLDPHSYLNETIPYVEAIIEKYLGTLEGMGLGNLPFGGAGFSRRVPDFIFRAGEDRPYTGPNDPDWPSIVPLDWDPANKYGVPTGDKLIQGCYHDMMRYNRRGRMVRAFPTYCLLFVDEGPWMDGRRVWTRYFVYHSLSSINVVKERNNPADTCYLILTNVYGALDHEERLPPSLLNPNPGLPWYNLKQISYHWQTVLQELNPRIKDDMLIYRAKQLNAMQIRPGARIHLRIGYGASAADLPVVFNGTVAEISADEDIHLIAQGDGIELTNVFTNFDPEDHTSVFNYQNEPKNIIEGIMTERHWLGRFFGDAAEASPFGIEHFGVLKKYKPLNQTFGKPELAGKVRQKAWNSLAGLPWWLYNDFDITKNIYSSAWKAYLNTEDARSAWDRFIMRILKSGNRSSKGVLQDIFWWDGEDNIQLQLGNRTPWDIFVTLAKTIPDYIVAVHPHQFRSTLFFGLPFFPVRYGYVLWPEGKNRPKDDPKRYGDRMKPFVQFHVLSSVSDIINNGIKASSKLLVHNCAAQYTLGSGTAVTETVFADDTIRSDEIRTEIIDTGILQDLFGLPDGLLNAIGFAKAGEERAMQVARSHVRDSFREMYQGFIVVLGDPAIKPYDLVHISDLQTEMFGTVSVGKVVHEMSLETGFITSIKPDLVTALTESPYQKWLNMASMHMVPLGFAIVKGWTIFKAYRQLRAFTWARALRNLADRGIELWHGVKTVAQTLRTTRSIINGLRDVRRLGETIGLAAAPETLGFSLIGLLVWEAIWIALENIARKVILYFENKNVIKIYPLYLKGKPYVAGISGWQKIVPGIKDPWYWPSDNEAGFNFDDPFGGPASGVRTDRHPPSPYAGTANFILPVPKDAVTISEPYGTPRNNRRGFHTGIDLASRTGLEGLPIYAVAGGTVVQAMEASESAKTAYADYGGFVVIDHGNGLQSLYAHLRPGGVLVRPGQKVNQGEVIGEMGTTGLSTGPHLHLEMLLNGEPVDPKIYISF